MNKTTVWYGMVAAAVGLAILVVVGSVAVYVGRRRNIAKNGRNSDSKTPPPLLDGTEEPSQTDDHDSPIPRIICPDLEDVSHFDDHDDDDDDQADGGHVGKNNNHNNEENDSSYSAQHQQ